jgi:hypothetical protein
MDAYCFKCRAVKGGGKVYQRGGAKLYQRKPQQELESVVVC